MKIVISGMGLLSDDEIELFEKTQHSIWGDTDDYDGPAKGRMSGAPARTAP